MNDRRRPRPPARPKPAGPLTGPVQLDDATRNALILFNARLEAQEARDKEQRRVDKAAKAKDDAAARVRALDADPKATAEKKAEAQAAYLAALDAWNRAKAGEPAAPGDAAEDAAEDAEDGDADTAEGETPDAGASDTADADTAEGETPDAGASAEGDTTAEDDTATTEGEPAEA